MDHVVYGKKPVLLTLPYSGLQTYSEDLAGLLNFMANNALPGFEEVRSVTRPEEGLRSVKNALACGFGSLAFDRDCVRNTKGRMHFLSRGATPIKRNLKT